MNALTALWRFLAIACITMPVLALANGAAGDAVGTATGAVGSSAPSARDTASGHAGGSTFPRKGRVRFSLARGADGLVLGQVVYSWEHDGNNYRLQSVTETTGLAALLKPMRVMQVSQGDITAAGLRPREFRHERVKGLDTASFDWKRGVVSYEGKQDKIAVGTQDMLSLYCQLVLLGVKRGPLEVPIATGRKLENYRFEIVGKESVTLPDGKRQAVRMKSRSSGDDTIEVWIVPEQRGLPVKIRFTDRKGEVFDQLAQDIAIQETQ
ncbi:MAG: DUF3108 domain-containing protein [Sulfuritalea sp.]|nr:DUF3108 domain-containing protein [Sulfuritalea sp.]